MRPIFSPEVAGSLQLYKCPPYMGRDHGLHHKRREKATFSHIILVGEGLMKDRNPSRP